MMLGDLYLSKHNLDSAKYYFNLAYKGNPKNPNFSIKLGDIELYEGRFENSLSHYKEALTLSNSDHIKLKIVIAVDHLKGSDEALAVVKSFSGFEQSQQLQNLYLSLSLKSEKERY